jgi:hypothetical protein
VIGLYLTCGYCEDVYVGLEWDIVNVSLPTMTLGHLAVNLSLGIKETRSDFLWLIHYR